LIREDFSGGIVKNISRRNFLKYLGAGVIGIIAKPKFSLAKKNDFRASDVIQCFDENATSGNTINESVVQIMMDESIQTLTGINNLGEAWKSILPDINENSIISIKVNCMNYEVPTHPEFVNCIINGLTQMEFGSVNYKRNNIIIWDRFDDELSDSGYIIYTGNEPNTVRCFGSDHSGVGYDTTCPLHINGPGGTIAKYPSRIMSLMSDYVIDAGVLKDHDWAYITLSLKNHYGSIDQPVDYNLHYNHCNPCIPSLNQQIRDVINPNNMQKIFIVDALFGRINWGPMGSPNCNPKKLIMSLDTVACDYHGQNVINEERVAQGYSTINAPYITTAAQSQYNLGTTDINLIEINNPSNIQESRTVGPADGVLKVFPNPFHRKTLITLSLTRTSSVHLDLINTSGRIVDKIYSGHLSKNVHRIGYNINKKLSSGTYFVRFSNQGKTQVKKVMILH